MSSCSGLFHRAGGARKQGALSLSLLWAFGRGSILSHQGTADLSPCFHLPGQAILGVTLFLARGRWILRDKIGRGQWCFHRPTARPGRRGPDARSLLRVKFDESLAKRFGWFQGSVVQWHPFSPLFFGFFWGGGGGGCPTKNGFPPEGFLFFSLQGH